MDPFIEKRGSIINQSAQIMVAFSLIMRFLMLLAGYQILTDDELTRAGIRLDNHRNEDKL